MVSNITFSGYGITISEEFIGKFVNTIFPGGDYLYTLILILMWFLVGIIALSTFFYFSKKRNMWKSISKLQKIIFSVSLGWISFMIVFLSYLPFYLLGLDFLNMVQGKNILLFMILSFLLLYCCLALASSNYKGRPFISKSFKNLGSFFMLFTMTFLAISLTIKTKEYRLLLWIIVDVIYFHYNVHPIFKKKKRD